MNSEELDEILEQFDLEHDYLETKRAIETWHTRKLNEAVREEWKLISEVDHSANITAELYIGRAREERLAELEERTDDPA